MHKKYTYIPLFPLFHPVLFFFLNTRVGGRAPKPCRILTDSRLFMSRLALPVCLERSSVSTLGKNKSIWIYICIQLCVKVKREREDVVRSQETERRQILWLASKGGREEEEERREPDSTNRRGNAQGRSSGVWSLSTCVISDPELTIRQGEKIGFLIIQTGLRNKTQTHTAMFLCLKKNVENVVMVFSLLPLSTECRLMKGAKAQRGSVKSPGPIKRSKSPESSE